MTTDVTNIQNAYQMILRMCVRAPFSLLVAMIMAFSVSPRVASVYLIAVIILGIVLAIITLNAHKYFTQVFKKYDKLNESVQENVSAMRVVKAYVREDYERGKFGKASYNIYKMFIKAEGIVSLNAPSMMLAIYSCILFISWLSAHMIIASGNNKNQVQAMADNVSEVLGKAGYTPRQVEGYATANWILMDYTDIIVHVFSEEDRLFYDLERIWRDGKVTELEELA